MAENKHKSSSYLGGIVNIKNDYSSILFSLYVRMNNLSFTLIINLSFLWSVATLTFIKYFS